MRLLLLLLLGSLMMSQAEPPRRAPLNKYAELWNNSLLTVPPPPEITAPVEETTPLDDYVLGGYTQMADGYFVSLINKTDPTQRITISPGQPGSAGYSVLQVEKNPLNFTEARVLVKVGAQQKWIGYDDKFLQLSQPAAAAQAAPAAAQNQQ